MIFQSFNLILSRTALENVELPMIFAGRSAAGPSRSWPNRPWNRSGWGHACIIAPPK